jgi:hypothetical protein
MASKHPFKMRRIRHESTQIAAFVSSTQMGQSENILGLELLPVAAAQNS